MAETSFLFIDKNSTLGQLVESFFLKYWQVATWCIGGLCTIHGSILLWILKLISKKVGRPEFENRVELVEKQIGGINAQLILISRQNGEIVAGLNALEKASKVGDENIKELLEWFEKRPWKGRKGDVS